MLSLYLVNCIMKLFYCEDEEESGKLIRKKKYVTVKEEVGENNRKGIIVLCKHNKQRNFIPEVISFERLS